VRDIVHPPLPISYSLYSPWPYFTSVYNLFLEKIQYLGRVGHAKFIW